MAILIKFNNPNADDITLNIYRSDTEMDRSKLPAPLATLTGKPSEYLDKTAVQGKTYFYIFEAVGNNDRDISRNIKLIAAETRGPGNNILKEGTRELGVYDVMVASDLLDYQQLFAKLNNPAGFTASSFAYWVKYARKGKVFFVPSAPVGVATPQSMKDAGFMGDGKIIEQNGFKYRVRLARGCSETDEEATAFLADKTALVNYDMDTFNVECEFNDLMYPLINVTPIKQRLSNKRNGAIKAITGSRYVPVKEAMADMSSVTRTYYDATDRTQATCLRGIALNTAGAFWPVLELIEG